jgi:hypothetical protein
MRRLAGRSAVLCAAVGLLTAAPFARQELTRGDATTMEQKLGLILARGSAPAGGPRQPMRTSFTDREVNSFLKYSDLVHLPPGVMNPRLTIADGGHLEGRAIVDLDAVRKSKERGVLDPLAYVSGQVEVDVIGTLRATNGQGTFELQSATLGGVSIPKSLLQELVTYYSRTPESPNGIDLDKPFPLPASIQAVETRRGTATVVQ